MEELNDDQILAQLRQNDSRKSNAAALDLLKLISPNAKALLRMFKAAPHLADDLAQAIVLNILTLTQKPDFVLRTSFKQLSLNIGRSIMLDDLKQGGKVWWLKKGENIEPVADDDKLYYLYLEGYFDNSVDTSEVDEKWENIAVDENYIQRLKNKIHQLQSRDAVLILKEILNEENENLDEFDSLLNQLIILTASSARQIQSADRSEKANSQLVENADVYALSISPKVREIIKDGASTLEEVAAGLHKAGISTKNGNEWHLSTVKLLLERLNRLEPDQPIELNKEHFLGKMSKAIDEVRAEGATTALAIAKALNEKNILTKGGKQWYAATVQQLLHKLEIHKNNGLKSGISL